MMIFAYLYDWTSDAVLFPAIQVAVITFSLFVALREWAAKGKAGHGGLTLQVTRSVVSMGRFYGTYAAISGLLVAICLTTDVAKNHRVLNVTIKIGYARVSTTDQSPALQLASLKQERVPTPAPAIKKRGLIAVYPFSRPDCSRFTRARPTAMPS